MALIKLPPSGSKESLVGALIGLLVLSIAILGLIKLTMNPQPGSSSMELFKAVLQLGVISVAGAALAMLSFNYQFAREQEETERENNQARKDKKSEERRQKRLRDFELISRRLEYREDLLRTILGRATSSYSAVKKVRRLLRARALVEDENDKTILPMVYDEQMMVVNDAQLEFENLKRDVENSELAFSQADEIVKNLVAIDRYLGKLISEYERRRPRITNDISTQRLSQFLRLQDFLAKSKHSLFMRRVVHPFHEVQKLIRADLLNPQLVDLTSLVDPGEGEEAPPQEPNSSTSETALSDMRMNVE